MKIFRKGLRTCLMLKIHYQFTSSGLANYPKLNKVLTSIKFSSSIFEQKSLNTNMRIRQNLINKKIKTPG